MNKRVIILIVLISLSQSAQTFVESKLFTQSSSYKQIVYFTAWSIYQRNYFVMNMPGNQITHINYGFANVGSDCRVIVGDSWADTDKTFDGDTWDQPLKGNFNQLIKFKAKYPHIKTAISIGGWTWSTMFPTCASSQQNRDTFASSVLDFVNKYSFDGVDIDWEYPTAAQRNDYTLFLQAIRSKIGSSKYLTIASSADVGKLANLDIPAVSSTIDWINIMSYDFHGSWDSITNHQSPLYVSDFDKQKGLMYSAEEAVKYLISQGVDRSRLIMGAPIYGRSWSNVNCNSGEFGLFQSGQADSTGTWEAGVYDYKDIVQHYKTDSNYHFHEQTQSAWLCTSSGKLISYDDLRANSAKCNYIVQNKLGGIMYWEISADLTDSQSLISNSYQKLSIRTSQENNEQSENSQYVVVKF